MKAISRIISVLSVALCITFPMISEARIFESYSERPIMSVMGDSTSSYLTKESCDVEYYGPYGSNCAIEMPEEDMWWAEYANKCGYNLGMINGVGSSCVATPDDDKSSFNNANRYQILGRNGGPDIIAIFGGINDVHNYKVTPGIFEYRYNLLVNRIHNFYEDVKLILIAPFHCKFYYDDQIAKNNAFADIIEQAASDSGDYFVDLRDRIDFTTDITEPFGIHPNMSGMDRVASDIQESLGTTGIADIRAQLEYDRYVIKVNAYDPDYDNLLFKFSLTDSSTGEKIYNTSWQKDNCFILDEVNPDTTYVATAEIDNNNDGIAEGIKEKRFSNLPAKREGTTVYNDLDYGTVYNFNTYVESYPDIYMLYRTEPEAALEHFVNYGISEGRKASEDFDVASYRNQYADLRSAFGWDNYPAYYYHYILNGQAEGRVGAGCEELVDPLHNLAETDFSPVYDYYYYKDNNPDLVIAFGGDDVSLFGHYLTYGLYEGRQASANFNLWTYIGNYEDLRNAFGWDLPAYVIHYINHGQYEGRIAV